MVLRYQGEEDLLTTSIIFIIRMNMHPSKVLHLRMEDASVRWHMQKDAIAA